MTPVVAGGDATHATASLATYSIDDDRKTFVQATYSSSGEQVNYAGSIAPFQRGLLSLGVTNSDNSVHQSDQRLGVRTGRSGRGIGRFAKTSRLLRWFPPCHVRR